MSIRLDVSEVRAYKTSDNRLFESKLAAIAHQKTITFEYWYTSNYIEGSYGGDIESEDIEKWLVDHAEELQEFLQIKLIAQGKGK